MAEYGVENHIFEILEEAPASKLLELENKYIKMFRTIGTVHGLNVNGTNPTKLDYSGSELATGRIETTTFRH